MIKLNRANFDKDGYSCVSIDTDCGRFYGTAQVHPEDINIQSSFIGCEIAEYRATIAYFEEKLKRLNIEIKTLESLKNDFIKTYREQYHECVLLEKRLKQKQELKKEYKENIKTLKGIIKNKVENRIIILNKIEKKKLDREEK